MKYLMPILLELTKVNPVTGDTIVRQRYVTQSEIHKYRGDFECIGNKWRLHTETGFYDNRKIRITITLRIIKAQ